MHFSLSDLIRPYDYDKLFVASHKEVWWVSNGYWMLRLDYVSLDEVPVDDLARFDEFFKKWSAFKYDFADGSFGIHTLDMGSFVEAANYSTPCIRSEYYGDYGIFYNCPELRDVICARKELVTLFKSLRFEVAEIGKMTDPVFVLYDGGELVGFMTPMNCSNFDAAGIRRSLTNLIFGRQCDTCEDGSCSKCNRSSWIRIEAVKLSCRRCRVRLDLEDQNVVDSLRRVQEFEMSHSGCLDQQRSLLSAKEQVQEEEEE